MADDNILGLDLSAGVLDPSTMRVRRTERGLLEVAVGDAVYVDVTVRRAYPLEASDRFIGFNDADGEEIGMLEDPTKLDADSRAALDEQLALTYFLPTITEVTEIGEDFGVVHADVTTTSGPRQIEIRGIRSSIRILSAHRALIEDADGNRYELADYRKLPNLTREILGL